MSGVDLGDWYRKGSDGKQDPKVMQGMLDMVAADKIAAANGETLGSMPIHPKTKEDAKAAGGMAYEGWKYYCTNECYHTNAATFLFGAA